MTCTLRDNQTPLPAGTIGYGWLWNQGSVPAEFGISPVQSTSLFLSDWGEVKSSDFRSRVCPGTPLTFTTLQESQRTRREIDIDGIRLIEYPLNDSLVGFSTGFGISVP